MEKDTMEKNGGMDIISKEDWFKNYFVVPRQLANAGEALTDFEVRVLLKFFESSRGEGQPIADVKLEDIGEAVGRSKVMVSRTVRDLEIKEVLEIESRQRKIGFGTYNEYKLRLFREWWQRWGKRFQKHLRKEKLAKYKNVEMARKKTEITRAKSEITVLSG